MDLAKLPFKLWSDLRLLASVWPCRWLVWSIVGFGAIQ